MKIHMMLAFSPSSVSSCAMGVPCTTGSVSKGKALDLGNGSTGLSSTTRTSCLLENVTMSWAEMGQGLNARRHTHIYIIYI